MSDLATVIPIFSDKVIIPPFFTTCSVTFIPIFLFPQTQPEGKISVFKNVFKCLESFNLESYKTNEVDGVPFSKMAH